jgi:hypothetical protein
MPCSHVNYISLSDPIPSLLCWRYAQRGTCWGEELTQEETLNERSIEVCFDGGRNLDDHFADGSIHGGHVNLLNDGPAPGPTVRTVALKQQPGPMAMVATSQGASVTVALGKTVDKRRRDDDERDGKNSFEEDLVAFVCLTNASGGC